MNNYKSGFVTLLGRPNVGKSTLINKLVGKKITITSPVAQTTRHKLKAILTKTNGQIIFVDTPGVHKPHHRLGEILVKNAKASIKGVDIVIFVIDASEEPGRGDEYIKDFLVGNQTKFMVALNKWDLVSKEFKSLASDNLLSIARQNISVFSNNKLGKTIDSSNNCDFSSHTSDNL